MNFRRVIEAAQKFNLTSSHKCTLSVIYMDHLGYTISESKLESHSERFQPLEELPLPLDTYSLHHTIGMFSYYSHWIANYSKKIAPCIQFKAFTLTKMAEKIFRYLKAEIANAVAYCIDETIPFVAETATFDHCCLKWNW